MKSNSLFILLSKLCKGAELYPQDAVLQEELAISERTLTRYIKTLEDIFIDQIIKQQKRVGDSAKPVTVYRLRNDDKDMLAILKYMAEERNDINYVLQSVYANDPTMIKSFNDDEIREAISRNLNANKDAYLIRTSPFEDMQSPFATKLFIAVKNREYRDITYRFNDTITFKNAKCLKLIFTDNNWYLACETAENRLQLLRINFIVGVDYSTNKTSYQKSVLERYQTFFDRLQNAMSLCDKPLKRAVCKARPNIARYFAIGMKQFFISQKYIETTQNGSIIFSINYTQPLEILPFIKRWLPDIEVLEPQELKDTLRSDLSSALTTLQ
ncbi:hypothetical protein FACS189487_00300 [Campylobacterota bacterium]|nr:hypothetical protein FACS189487_00300 [Campylobacterota bacterium]